MDLIEIAKKLESLLKLEADVALIYDEIVQKIPLGELKEKISSFRDDHRRHIQILSTIVNTINGVIPEIVEVSDLFKSELKSLESITNTEKALRVLEKMERVINSQYEEALSWDIDPQIEEILDENLEDEQQHLAFILKKLSKL